MDRPLVTTTSRVPRCGNCGIEIPWPPVRHRGRSYCCGGCAQGGPCYCSYDIAELYRHDIVPDIEWEFADYRIEAGAAAGLLVQ